jgi:hypothetical protein
LATFPQLEFDDKVQIGDKVRLSGSRSFVSKGSTAIAAMTIKPDAETGEIAVYNADTEQRYLDWVYTAFEMDIDSSNNAITFNEGGSNLTATISNGTYSLAELATQIQTQLDAAGGHTYTVSVSSEDKFTISATGQFSLLPSSANILEQLGFKESTGVSLSGSSSYTGKRMRYVTRKVTLEVDGSNVVSKYIKLYSEAGDSLFSSDSDLKRHESDILKWLPDDRSSYKYAHRRAQERILAFLDEKGYTDIYRNKYTIDSIVNIDEVKEWSTFLTLRLIFQGFKNASDDVFGEKVNTYLDDEKEARNRVVLRLDVDGDGDVDENSQEALMISTINGARR